MLTCLPGTMNTLATMPTYGLASKDEAGRRQAIEFVGRARTAALALQSEARSERAWRRSRFTRLLVKVPRARRVRSNFSPNRCVKSAAGTGRASRFGLSTATPTARVRLRRRVFFRSKNELKAIEKSATKEKGTTPCRIAINWGRSVIEARDPEAALSHLEAAQKAALLGALVFSGCTPNDPLYGKWEDSHAPFGETLASDPQGSRKGAGSAEACTE